MKFRSALLVLAVVASTSPVAPVAGQRLESPVIVVFHDDAPFRSFVPGASDARARANPAAWAYLDQHVLGTVQTLERQHGFRAAHVYSATLRGFAARLTGPQIEALQRDPLVNYIEPDTAMQLLDQTLPWGIDRIDTDVSSTRAGDGAGVVPVNVYVIDNGVDRTHPDLNVVNHVNLTLTANAPTCAHGTRVAGVAAARDDAFGVVGAAPGAAITAVKVTTCDPVFFFASATIKGVDWVTANAVLPAVANMSIGGLANSTLDAAVRRSADRGVFYAIAAGNNSFDACLLSPQRVGTYPGVMTVAATRPDDREASFSNFGRCVDIWAPGEAILTDDLGGGLVTSAGTSYAAPHVAGTAALYLASNPTATAAAVEAALKSSAIYPGSLSKNLAPIRMVYAGGY